MSCLVSLVCIHTRPPCHGQQVTIPLPGASKACHDLALTSVQGSLEATTGRVAPFTNHAAYDVDANCRDILVSHSVGVGHVFGDILSKLTDFMFDHTRTSIERVFVLAESLISNPPVLVYRPCLTKGARVLLPSGRDT
jgi:hypothetical protein